MQSISVVKLVSHREMLRKIEMIIHAPAACLMTDWDTEIEKSNKGTEGNKRMKELGKILEKYSTAKSYSRKNE